MMTMVTTGNVEVAEIGLLERGRNLASLAQQITPTGSALKDLEAATALGVSRIAKARGRLRCKDKQLAGAVAEAVRSAFAVGFQTGRRGLL